MKKPAIEPDDGLRMIEEDSRRLLAFLTERAAAGHYAADVIARERAAIEARRADLRREYFGRRGGI
jgi:hypothetical protein